MSAASPTAPPVEGSTVLAFLNEVAGGRMLLNRIRELVDQGAAHVAIAAPQNQPEVGQIVSAEEVRDAAVSRVEVTRRILESFGIGAVATIFDPQSRQALDDAVRAFSPSRVLISARSENRYGPTLTDLITYGEDNFEVPVEHIPVRIEDDAISWNVTHTLVVATQTVNSPGLVDRLIALHGDTPHRYTLIAPRSGEISREEVCERLASTLAAMYRQEIDATGQPMSPEPFAAVQNGIEHFRVDDILISTFAGEESSWLQSGLIDRIKEITNKPVSHFEVDGAQLTVAVGAEGSGS